MNDELTKRVFDWVSATAEKIGDFAGKEIPPFITEYLTWKFYESAFSVGVYLLGVILYAVLTFVLYKIIMILWKKAEDLPRSSYDLGATMTSVFGGLAVLVCLAIAIAKFPTQNILDCVQIKIAPKVYLVERAAELYKEAKK